MVCTVIRKVCVSEAVKKAPFAKDACAINFVGREARQLFLHHIGQELNMLLGERFNHAQRQEAKHAQVEELVDLEAIDMIAHRICRPAESHGWAGPRIVMLIEVRHVAEEGIRLLLQPVAKDLLEGARDDTRCRRRDLLLCDQPLMLIKLIQREHVVVNRLLA